MFSNEEKRDMLKLYYICRRNGTEAANMYFETYPERRQPDRSLFHKIDSNISNYGSFSKPRLKYGSRVTEEETQIVLNEV